jgi:hypothetical protein
MNKLKFILYVSFILFFTACNHYSHKKLKLLKVTEVGSAKISDSSIVQLINEKLKKEVSIRYSLDEDTALLLLRNNKIDMAIIPNNTNVSNQDLEVRTIMPLLPRILIILTNNIKKDEYSSIKELFESKNVIFEEMSHYDSVFFNKFFRAFGIKSKKIKSYSAHKIDINKWNDSVFVYVGLTHLHNPDVKRLINKGAGFVPLDKVSNLGKGSTVEGFNMIFPKLYPFILPKSYYHGKPKKAVLTIAIPDILVANSQLNNYTVYSVIKTILENKSKLSQNDNIYSLLNTNFKDKEFSFPLHEGTKEYIKRNEPSIWAKYANILWPFVSMIAIFIGGFTSVRQRMKQRKKVRIETLYTSLLKIRKKAYNELDEEAKDTLLKEMRKIRTKAFDALMDNKLNANESFSIFLSLYSEIVNEIKDMDNIND